MPSNNNNGVEWKTQNPSNKQAYIVLNNVALELINFHYFCQNEISSYDWEFYKNFGLNLARDERIFNICVNCFLFHEEALWRQFKWETWRARCVSDRRHDMKIIVEIGEFCNSKSRGKQVFIQKIIAFSCWKFWEIGKYIILIRIGRESQTCKQKCHVISFLSKMLASHFRSLFCWIISTNSFSIIL